MSIQQNAGLELGRVKSRAARSAEQAEGLAWARRWRERNKPYFDALYGPHLRETCPSCGAKR